MFYEIAVVGERVGGKGSKFYMNEHQMSPPIYQCLSFRYETRHIIVPPLISGRDSHSFFKPAQNISINSHHNFPRFISQYWPFIMIRKSFNLLTCIRNAARASSPDKTDGRVMGAAPCTTGDRGNNITRRRYQRGIIRNFCLMNVSWFYWMCGNNGGEKKLT